MKSIIYFWALSLSTIFSWHTQAENTNKHVDNISSASDIKVWSKICKEMKSKEPDFHNNPCFNYIQGFVSGARIVDKLFVDHLAKDHGSNSELVERAYKTRIGPKNDKLSNSSLAPFCIPDNKKNIDITLNITSNLEHPVQTVNLLNIQIEKLLRTLYPCHPDRD